MTIPSHVKQSGQSSPRKAILRGQIRFAWLGRAADDSETRAAKAPRSSYTMTIPSHDDSGYSWETRVLAEDASSQLAAGIWPPRAYPCSFCRREFRSAQALGGHMNVHRRDRARLRHSSPPPPSPAFGPILASPHARSLFQVRDEYSANLSAQYGSESLMPLNSPPIPSSTATNLPITATPHASQTSTYSSDNTRFLRLRLQQLASEAAASLLQYPQQQERSTPSGLLFLMPSSIPDCTSLPCHSSEGTANMKEKAMEIVSTSSSFPSPLSSAVTSTTPLQPVRDGVLCRRDVPTSGQEKERPCTENDRNHLLSQIKTGSDSLKAVLNGHAIRKTRTEAAPCMLWRKGASSYACGDRSEGDLDLELRLGRKPP